MRQYHDFIGIYQDLYKFMYDFAHGEFLILSRNKHNYEKYHTFIYVAQKCRLSISIGICSFNEISCLKFKLEFWSSKQIQGEMWKLLSQYIH